MKPAEQFPARTASCRAALIVIVLVSLAFTAAALALFMQKASTDLLAAAREADANRLRAEAYSALESTLAVIETFREVGGGPLRSPSEGWGDALAWTDYEPAAGREVKVSFSDESGRLPLARVDFDALMRVFDEWEMPVAEAERLADALLDWMREGHVRRGFASPLDGDYERAQPAFKAPRRPLRSWSELAAIDGVRELLFDEQGRLNDLGHRFTGTFSRWDYPRPNLNAASPAVLAAVGRYSETQLRQLADYRAGAGIYANRLRSYFLSPDELGTLLGDQTDTSGWSTTIQALRITIEVWEGRGHFSLSAVVAPPNGARLVPAPEIPVDPLWAGRTRQPGPTGNPASDQRSLNYPFTLLEIVENAVVLNPSNPDAPVL